MKTAVVVSFAALLIACSGSDDGGGQSAPVEDISTPAEEMPTTSDPSEEIPAEAPWEELIVGDWTLGPGEEKYFCARRTLDEDVYISEMDPMSPLGTHHTVLSIGEVSGPDGTTECANPVERNSEAMIFGSGVNTPATAMPPGVAIHVSAGQQLLLNLHVFNPGVEELSGLSGTLIRRVDAADVDFEGRVGLWGPTGFSIPAGEVTTVSAECDFSVDTTLFLVLAHMHQIGSHMKITAKSSTAGDVVLWDQPYDFESQVFERFDPIAMPLGDTVLVECTYQNDTDQDVGFGTSSLDEMCFAALGTYPPAGRGECVDVSN